ncbi:hypothetical protein CEXT_122141 [Caerostris extrusa]|uniref:Uncharacterized protein n=1 Tax=Caerostris extrusa TaxID=172846 RepID=A0AAV4QHU4_CAEEX|nr:hypothetical protein CEXT_122141 [Caerostris extrusa]
MERFNHYTLSSKNNFPQSLFSPHQKPSANKRTSSVALKRSIAAFRRSFTSGVRRLMYPFITSSPPADHDVAAAA